MGLGQPAVGAGASVIAALLVETDAGLEDRAALYRRAIGLLPAVSLSGPLAALCDIAASARADASDEELAPALREAARETLEALSDVELAETLVDAAYRLGALCSEAETLLVAAGGVSLWCIAPRLRDEPLHPVSRELRTLVRRLDEETWIEALGQADRRDFSAVAALFPLIRTLPAPLVWPVASQLLRHREIRVRHQVTAFLLGRPEPVELWKRLATDALRDSDPALADIARSAIVVHPEAGRDLVELALNAGEASRASGRLRADLEGLRDALKNSEWSAQRVDSKDPDEETRPLMDEEA